MKKVKLFVALLVVVTSVVGCGPTPAATAVPLPTYTPYPTHTPWPIHAPYPTYTPYPTLTPWPTYTPIPGPTDTPLPTVTNTAEPIPAAKIPDGWQVYESIDGTFTVPHPSSWEIEQEKRNSVSFMIPNGRHITIYLTADAAGVVFGGTNEENVRVLAGQVADGWADQIGFTGFKILDRGAWHGDLYGGYYVEFMIYKDELFEEDKPSRMRAVHLLAEGHVIGTMYSAFLVDQFTDNDRQVYEQVLNAIRVKP